MEGNIFKDVLKALQILGNYIKYIYQFFKRYRKS